MLVVVVLELDGEEIGVVTELLGFCPVPCVDLVVLAL